MKFFHAVAVSLALAGLPALATAQDAPAEMAQGAPITLGPLVLTGGFARATLPGAPVAGGFVTIQNTGTEDDTLIGAASDLAGHMEVHEMKMDGQVMKMRQLEGGLPIPAGQTVVLKPGGFHVMFMDLKGPLVEGQMVDVTLTFAKAGSVVVPLMIGAPNATAPGAMPGMQGMGTMDGNAGMAAPASSAN
ncbi:MAG: copper chaperone PCu(A)C [Limimaricola sp.]|uniref:copper chaperone PCu(A)C n=1 Tax=Limimaricola sp. TaxID=2211665 RepID=UPI001E0C8DE2|nr:copper chaperone PCu(A)C [Limimaricola sp.]MBI1416541.1 copper chaperone PCu(A)C [Limimaricola sp.]